MLLNFNIAEKLNQRLFAIKSNNYLYEEFISFEEAVTTETGCIHLPLVVDTEFKDCSLDLTNPDKSLTGNKTITVQVKHIHGQGMIFTHPDSEDIARHPILNHECITLDYLATLGFDIQTKHHNARLEYNENIRELHIHLFAHFALAELFRIFRGWLREQIEKMILFRAGKHEITHGRRLQTSNSLRKNHAQTWVSFDRSIVWINGHPFKLRLTFWDTIAILGNQSLEKLAKLGNYKMDSKKIISDKEKEIMDWVYLNKPEEFDEYALGDLCVYDILTGVHQNIEHIFEETDLIDYWKPGESMRFTIGATVAKLFEAALMKEMIIKDTKTLRFLTQHGTSEEIKKNNTTAKYLAKVDGGRCRNNRPTDISVNSLICDIDINGCYGNGLRNQSYPLGRPVIIDYKISSERNDYETLGSFLKKYRKELIPGLWQLRVSTKPDYSLKYPQDLLQSWIPPKSIENIKTDTELEATEWWTEDNVGLNKIFTHEVHLAVITHDILQWIEHTCGKQQSAELMNNLVVISAQFYPASCKVNSVAKVLESNEKYKGVNTTEVKGKKAKSKVSIERECHAWCEINIGELIVNTLLCKRKQYSEDIPDEKIFNTLYKLIINTIYGDQVSPYFEIGNTCVGNNITARARVMAWYMEKGFHGFQSITDGCAFELNRVVYPDNGRITATTVFNAHSKGTDSGNFNYAPLNQSEINIEDWLWDKENKLYKATLIQNNEVLTYESIGDIAMKHLQAIFPSKIDVLHKETVTLKEQKQIGQFTLEVKSIVAGASFHGSANYIFNQKENFYLPPKMRSYRDTKHKIIELSAESLRYGSDEYEPAKEFLKSLHRNPKSVQRGKCFLDKSILKPGTYRQHFDSRYESSPVFPGCSIERVRLLREFSLNQYTFQSHTQYKTWEREWQKLLHETGHSYEQFFLNDDGSVDVSEMVKTINKLICTGKEGWFKRGRLSKYLADNLQGLKNHTEIKCLEITRTALNECYGFEVSLDDEAIPSEDYIETEECDNW